MLDPITRRLLTEARTALSKVFTADNKAELDGTDRLLTDDQQVDITVALESVDGVLASENAEVQNG